MLSIFMAIFVSHTSSSIFFSRFVGMYLNLCQCSSFLFQIDFFEKKIDGVALNIIWVFISQCQTCTRKEDTSSMRIIVHKNRNVLHFELSF